MKNDTFVELHPFFYLDVAIIRLIEDQKQEHGLHLGSFVLVPLFIFQLFHPLLFQNHCLGVLIFRRMLLAYHKVVGIFRAIRAENKSLLLVHWLIWTFLVLAAFDWFSWKYIALHLNIVPRFKVLDRLIELALHDLLFVVVAVSSKDLTDSLVELVPSHLFVFGG